MTFPYKFEALFASTTKGVGEIPPATLTHLKNEQRAILSQYSSADRMKIEQRLESLKGVVDIVSNDTRIQVFINPPGGGWFWAPEQNFIRVDVKDLVEKPIEQNRFTIAHEGAHRRLTRMHLVPDELEKNGAFLLLNNILEDGRINLWLAGKYPKNHSSKIFEGMSGRYTESYNTHNSNFEEMIKSGNKFPHSGVAAAELLQMWIKNLRGEKLTIDARLPKEVKAFLNKVMPHVKNAWKSFPAPGSEAKGEAVIEAHAKKYMNLLLNKIWPEFKKLLEDDKKKRGLQEKMKEEEEQKKKKEDGEGKEKDKGKGSGKSDDDKSKGEGTSDDTDKSDGKGKGKGKDKAKDKEKGGNGLQDELTDAEKKEIEDAKGADGKVNTDKLSDKLKKKLQDYFDSLSKEEKDKLTKDAANELDAAMEEKAEEYEGKMGEDAGEGTESEGGSDKKGPTTTVTSGGYRKGRTEEEKKKQDDEVPDMPKDNGDRSTFDLRPSALIQKAKQSRTFGEFLKRLDMDGSLKRAYDRYKKFVEPVTQGLKSKLDSVFKKRQLAAEKGKQVDGDDIDEDALIEEEIRKHTGAPSPDLEPKVFKQKRRQEGGPRDYAFTILLDASGSMADRDKIHEAFKGLVVVAETLKHFNIDLEIIGFNWNLFELKQFDKTIDESKESIASILPQPFGPEAGTDIGFAISESVKRLEKRKAKNKTLIVLTDGEPSPRPDHSGPEYEVPNVIREAREESKVEVVGVGIGPGTDFVRRIFENGIANVPIEELGRELAIVIKKVIGN